MNEPLAAEGSARPNVFRLPGGEGVTVRPIRPHDAGRFQAYLRDLSGDARRSRFQGAVSELSPAQLDRLTRMDRPGELALLAFADAGGELQMVAEAIVVIAPGSGRGEIALSVADAWQGRGIGMLLLRHLECRARLFGARYLVGDVLRTNEAMKGLARKSGFAVSGACREARLIEIIKDLAVAQAGPPCHEQFAPAIAGSGLNAITARSSPPAAAG
jgi:GNAT superfamily N-acetyltransferase